MTAPTLLRQRFLAEPHTLRNERRDFHEWHRGRPHYLLWALDMDAPPLRARVAAAQRALHGLLLEGYVRQPHITLALCGFPATGPLRAEDEFDDDLITAQLAALQAMAPPAFELGIGGLESFSSAPFLSVHDSTAALATLRRCLHADGQHPQGGYVAHVTVGLYAEAWPTAEVARRFRALDDAPHLPCRITRLSLMGYVAADIGGELFTLADYHLAERRLQWREARQGLAGNVDRHKGEGVCSLSVAAGLPANFAGSTAAFAGKPAPTHQASAIPLGAEAGGARP